MVTGRQRALGLETEWLREYARTYLPSEADFAFPPEDLRREGITLVQLRYLFWTGSVVYSDKLDEPGALWVVAGTDCDGNDLTATIIVVTEVLSVKLVEVKRGKGRKEGANDAA